MNRKAVKLSVSGIVQGVGFRPFVYRLAVNLGLSGFVRNMGGSEVEIWIEGEKNKINSFIKKLREERPPSAEIDSLDIKEVNPKGYTSFKIKESSPKRVQVSMIPPDFSVCDECLKEVLDPSSRFYNYPFHSCAWCGPRFSIITRAPYDRNNTSMIEFPLCDQCLKEYNDPQNLRRFHAQGISCPTCGPKIYLVDSKGKKLDSNDPLREAASLLDEGYIIGIKGIGGFHIAAKATDDDVVAKLRLRKKRRTKPFALMALNTEVAKEIVEVDRKALVILKSPARPIVVLPRKTDKVSSLVSPGLKTLGIMLSYTPLHYIFLSNTRDKFSIMTSGNKRGIPMVTSDKEAFEKLNDMVDFFLIHNRRIVNRVDDSVVRFSNDRPTLLRRSRGYTPKWIKIMHRLSRPTIALGAMLNNVGAIGFNEYVILTQHIGDIENFETLEFLRKAIEFLVKNYKLNLKDGLVVVDKNPSYLTHILARKYLEEYDCKVVSFQHHVAHIASVMAEYSIEDSIGLAIDGAGYGDDGNIWGGEVFYIGENFYERLGHLEYIPLPGGDLATKYPVRLVLALMAELGINDVIEFAEKLGLVNAFPRGRIEAEIVLKTYKNSKLTSSLGRFLDAVSTLLGICSYRDYEGEPAIKLEESSWGGTHIGIKLEKEGNIIKTKEFFSNILDAYLSKKFNIRDIGYTVQFELGKALAEIALENQAKILVVSGGAAVNSIILKAIEEKFNKGRVLVNRLVPPGDGGLALGQIFLTKLLSYT